MKTTYSDDGVVMEQHIEYDNGVKTTEWCAIGRTSEWPVKSWALHLTDYVYQIRDERRQDFQLRIAP